MPDTVIIYEKNNAIVSAGFKDRRIVDLNVDEKENIYKVGNIFMGHVNKILLHLHAAYVDIGMEKNCYMELIPDFDYLTDRDHPDGELHVGDELVVQVLKDPARGKPATVTPKICIDNRLVLLEYCGKPKEISFSSKIKDSDFKKKVSKSFSGILDSRYSLLVRTNALSADTEEIIKDYKRAESVLSDIIDTYRPKKKGSLIYESVPNYIKEVRDNKEINCEKLLTDSPDVYVRLKDYFSEYQPELLDVLSFYSDKVLPLENLFDMKKNLREISSEKVWLKSGATIIIQQTEALVSIDINSSKASSENKNFKEGFRKLNLEAAEEILRQIKLRCLSGIIIIDFINEKNTSRKELFDEVKELYKNEKSIQLVDITGLGLIELTRKRERKPVIDDIKKYKLL